MVRLRRCVTSVLTAGSLFLLVVGVMELATRRSDDETSSSTMTMIPIPNVVADVSGLRQRRRLFGQLDPRSVEMKNPFPVQQQQQFGGGNGGAYGGDQQQQMSSSQQQQQQEPSMMQMPMGGAEGGGAWGTDNFEWGANNDVSSGGGGGGGGGGNGGFDQQQQQMPLQDNGSFGGGQQQQMQQPFMSQGGGGDDFGSNEGGQFQQQMPSSQDSGGGFSNGGFGDDPQQMMMQQQDGFSSSNGAFEQSSSAFGGTDNGAFGGGGGGGSDGDSSSFGGQVDSSSAFGVQDGASFGGGGGSSEPMQQFGDAASPQDDTQGGYMSGANGGDGGDGYGSDSRYSQDTSMNGGGYEMQSPQQPMYNNGGGGGPGGSHESTGPMLDGPQGFVVKATPETPSYELLCAELINRRYNNIVSDLFIVQEDPEVCSSSDSFKALYTMLASTTLAQGSSMWRVSYQHGCQNSDLKTATIQEVLPNDLTLAMGAGLDKTYFMCEDLKKDQSMGIVAMGFPEEGVMKKVPDPVLMSNRATAWRHNFYSAAKKVQELENEGGGGFRKPADVVVYLDLEAENRGLANLEFEYFIKRVPKDAETINVVSAPRCTKNKNCAHFATPLKEKLQELFPNAKSNLEKTSSTAVSFARMMEAKTLICPPTMSCLLPALTKEVYHKTFLKESEELYPWFQFAVREAKKSFHLQIEYDMKNPPKKKGNN